MTTPVFAAITLGSNSFNMLVARRAFDSTETAESIEIVAKYKRKVRLAEGIQADGSLSQEVMARGLDCLAMFAEKLEYEQVSPKLVAVIATATLRSISNADEFCQKALPILGQPIQVISGLEEAEFIYQGMAATTPGDTSRLVIDIGGASTEFIVGEADKVLFKTSLAMGSVTFNNQFFVERPYQSSAFDMATEHVAKQLAEHKQTLLSLDWQSAVGASGAVQSVIEVLAAQHGGALFELVVTLDSLYNLKAQVLGSSCPDLSDIHGLNVERAPTFASGVAILIALFELLNIPYLALSGGALREGVLTMLANRVTD